MKVSEEIVTNGTFILDAAAQLEGKPSMIITEETKEVKKNDIAGMEGM